MPAGTRRRIPTTHPPAAIRRAGIALAAGALAAGLSLATPGAATSKLATVPVAATTTLTGNPGNPGVTRTGKVITSLTEDKSRYAPGDTVTFTVDVTDATGSAISNGAVTLYFMAEQNAGSAPLTEPLTVANGASTVLTFAWTAPSADFTGYLVSAVATRGAGNALDSDNVAVDVSSSWTKFPRYGYMTANEFGNQGLTSAQAASVMADMTKHHIDGLQYYDWQYNHDQPLCGTVSSPCASWEDDGNQRTVYASAVENLINSGHADNIDAMAYNSIFSADNGACCGAPDYTSQGLGISPSWGIYQDTAHSKPLAFFQWDYMDPSNPAWQQFIVGQEKNAIQAFNFDGFHADTFGDPDTVDYTYNGQPAGVASDSCTTDTTTANSTTPVSNIAGSANWLNGTFPSFLSYAKSALGSKDLMFNPVTYDHAHCEANTSPNDILYTELWPNNQDQYWDYNTLQQAINQATSESASVSPTGTGKSLTVAAYADFNSSGGGAFDTPDVLLLDSTLFASGGSHEELGDAGNMLDNENFTTGSTPMSASLSAQVQNYYDFLTAYEDLLRDGQASTNQTVEMTGETVSSQAAPNSVWAFTKSDASNEIMQFINLEGENSILWQTGQCDNCSQITSPHPAPTQLTNTPVKYYYKNTPKAVMFASPDYNDGTTYSLPFTLGSDAKGNYVQFTLPTLSYWDMVYLNQTGPGNAPVFPGSADRCRHAERHDHRAQSEHCVSVLRRG